MRVHILFEFKRSSWGGGNQFLKALRGYFKSQGVYTVFSRRADVILFNSHHCAEKVRKIKNKFPDKVFIHRVDGPVSLIRGEEKGMAVDRLIFDINEFVADGTVFQSNWSREQSLRLGMKGKENEIVIMNAPDSKIFNRRDKADFNRNGKIKLVATSWSANFQKGFDIYEYLDGNLDFSKYAMTFIGNSPVKFKNIKHIKPLESKKLAEELKKHDIFITASVNDPCSNSLIEALHCGLPAAGRNSGGHPEIIGEGGELFNNQEDIFEAIGKIARNYDNYQSKIKLAAIEEIGEKYLGFFGRMLKIF